MKLNISQGSEQTKA